MFLSLAHARVSTSAGAFLLPASTYRYLGYTADVGIPFNHWALTFQLGSNQPKKHLGYLHWIGHMGGGAEWSVSSDVIRPYVGVGIGAYMDQINSMPGLTPALYSKGGIRIGLSSFGLQFEMISYFGINNLSDTFTRFVAWPMIIFQAGLYFGSPL